MDMDPEQKHSKVKQQLGLYYRLFIQSLFNNS